ncbi:MAG: chloride channel protein [Actinomycetota bacterium]
MTRAPLDRAAHVARWVVLATCVGVVSGALSAAFIEALDWATRTRSSASLLVWFLPLAGLAVGSAYHYLGRGLERGSNLIIEQIHSHSRWIPVRMSVLIFVCSVITHVFGGSSGREGAALQLAAGVTDPVSRRLGLDQRDRAVMLVTAIAGGFGSVFGVPVAGAVFALEVQRVGRVRHEAIVPAFVASFVGDGIVRALGTEHTHFPAVPAFSWDTGLALRLVMLGIIGGLAALLFVRLTHGVRGVLARTVPWYPGRVAVGGAVVAALVLLLGWREYSGLSVHLASNAFGGSVEGDSWAKLVLTSVTIGSGFVGGEFIPLFVTGALMGAGLADVIGADVSLFAMAGALAVLAGATNTPLAMLVLGVELFGGSGAVVFAVVCVAAYASSGHAGIYHAQPVAAHKSGRRD